MLAGRGGRDGKVQIYVKDITTGKSHAYEVTLDSFRPPLAAPGQPLTPSARMEGAALLKEAGEDIVTFLQGWYSLFPQHADRKLVISGESYGGHYIPAWANAILDHNEAVDAKKEEQQQQRTIPMAGVVIGNGCVNDTVQNSARYVEFLNANDLLPADPSFEPTTTAAADVMMAKHIGYSPNFYDYRVRNVQCGSNLSLRGRGNRNERIRTYNFPQDRCTESEHHTRRTGSLPVDGTDESARGPRRPGRDKEAGPRGAKQQGSEGRGGLRARCRRRALLCKSDAARDQLYNGNQ